jgi:hypothetical protein
MGVSCLRKAKSLESLDVSYTSVRGDGLRFLNGLSKLKELDLSGVKLSDEGFAAVCELRNLRTLRLNDVASLHGSEGFRGLRNLQRVELVGVTLSRSLFNELKELKNLSDITVGGIGMEGREASFINTLPNVRRLWIVDATIRCSFGDALECKNIEYLGFRQCSGCMDVVPNIRRRSPSTIVLVDE